MKSWVKWPALAVAAYALDPETAELLIWAGVAIVVALVELAGVVITARATVKAAGIKAMVEALAEAEEEDDGV